MTDKELKLAIQQAIIAFSKSPVYKASIGLFKTLGYNTERQNPLLHKSYDDFKDSFLGTDSPFNEEKACVKEWKSIDLLFQLTADEVSRQSSLFNTKQVDNTIIETYLFFSIELTKAEYNRTQLAQITREINKVFPMPVLIVFKYGESITLSVINRRLNKKDAQKDVLEKVTVIKDISTTSPHRAHIEILFDLSFSELQRVHKFTNFVELHNAWQKTLDTKELNKRFYRDLSNWYFWALQEVHFPKTNWAADKNSLFKEEKTKEHNAKNLIRLLTRLLFVWFVKEKNLVPDELFDESYIKDNLLNGFEPRKKKGFDHKTLGSKYYRAILQNLFFATLNQTVGKRDFRKDGQQMNVTNLMRYESYFKDPQAFIKLVEDIVPFMNGGLFECLDSPDPVLKGKKGGDVIIYEDGFSDRNDNTLCVPDYIFFGTGEQADLSIELGNKKQKDVTVNGLINILKSYKFTVTENTPIEEDIALDPELLGRVFENLLASYNPETKTTARKQTGSFYTPREIVNYMVDESLKAYLKQKLESEAGMKPEDAEVGLEFLVGYNEKAHLFDDKQTSVLINAIDNCKILDPACGSGAFPMGILHKLVHILHKLDPNNKLWKERQIAKAQAIDDSEIRDKLIEDIETSFESNELDYGRKLYLIENCIYGVDIQPIATQISKLRFFISLIVDQKANKTIENFGIRPLPNLETKFVAANTLIGIEKSVKNKKMFEDTRLEELEKKLKNIRHRLFSAKTPSTKKRLREKDKQIREEMGEIIEKKLNNESQVLISNSKEKRDIDYLRDLIKRNGEKQEYLDKIKKLEETLQKIVDKCKSENNKTAQQLVSWDPYNQNVSCDWFDPEWMFGIETGFDVVIGNPPYVQLQKDGGKLANAYKNCGYATFERTGDIYALFYEMGVNALKEKGYLCYITSNKWMRAGYGKSLRKFFISYNPELLIDCGPGVFENATVDVNILLIQNEKNQKQLSAVTLDSKAKDNNLAKFVNERAVLLSNLNEDSWFIGSNAEQQLKEKIEQIGKPLKDWDVNIYRGVLTGLNEAFIIDTPTKERLCAEDPKSAEIIKPILRGRDIKRYSYEWAGLWLIATGYDLDVPKLWPAVFKHLLQYEEKAKKRDDQGKNWWNLRACKYYQEFEKEKVVWQEMSQLASFSYDINGAYCNDTGRILTGNHIKFFVGFFNTCFFEYSFSNWYAGGALGDKGIRFKSEFMKDFPIPPTTPQNKPIIEKIELLVDEILEQKKAASTGSATDTTAIETQIDQLVYQLYDLTDEEIAIIEGSINGK